MVRFYMLVLIGMLCIGLNGQNIATLKGFVPKPSRLVISGFSYPSYFTGEVHASFLAEYSFSPDFELALQGFYDTYLWSDRFRVEVLSKTYIGEHFHLLAGMGSEFESSKYGQRPLPPRIGIIGGLGYGVNNNFLIEAKGNFQINESPMGAFGEPSIPMPKVYTLANKIKF